MSHLGGLDLLLAKDLPRWTLETAQEEDLEAELEEWFRRIGLEGKLIPTRVSGRL